MKDKLTKPIGNTAVVLTDDSALRNNAPQTNEALMHSSAAANWRQWGIETAALFEGARESVRQRLLTLVGAQETVIQTAILGISDYYNQRVAALVGVGGPYEKAEADVKKKARQPLDNAKSSLVTIIKAIHGHGESLKDSTSYAELLHKSRTFVGQKRKTRKSGGTKTLSQKRFNGEGGKGDGILGDLQAMTLSQSIDLLSFAFTELGLRQNDASIKARIAKEKDKFFDWYNRATAAAEKAKNRGKQLSTTRDNQPTKPVAEVKPQENPQESEKPESGEAAQVSA